MTICNFTDSYKKFIEKITVRWNPGESGSRPEDTRIFGDLRVLDMTDVAESTGYCSDEAAGIIRSRIRDEDVHGVRYIDDGNHHYLSRLWMEKIKKPFDLVVFDHHTDLQRPGLLPFLSCGSWVRDSLSGLIMLNDVYLIGVPDNTVLPEDLPADRIHVISETEAVSGRMNIPAGIFPIYVSIDLDVLAPEEYESIWDQGSMTKKRLLDWLGYLKTRRRAIAVDLCG